MPPTGESDTPCWISLKSGFLIRRCTGPDSATGIQESDEHDWRNLGAGHARSIYVSVIPRKGLSFQFIEVKYRRHLRARSPELLNGITARFNPYVSDGMVFGGHKFASLRAVRRVKAGALRFTPTRPIGTDEGSYGGLGAEIDRMGARRRVLVCRWRRGTEAGCSVRNMLERSRWRLRLAAGRRESSCSGRHNCLIQAFTTTRTLRLK